VARYLLTRTDARDIEIAARGLEDAFIALTGEGAERRFEPHEAGAVSSWVRATTSRPGRD
jgi:hypothetical protein